MCGICFVCNLFATETPVIDFPNSKFVKFFKRRGPNHYQEEQCEIADNISLLFISAILHLRGSQPTFQPFKDTQGNILLWNGEIFGGLHVDPTSSDTCILSHHLSLCKNDAEIVHIFSSIQGPFAFIFYQVKGFLWFGRDIFGRRSLVWNKSEGTFKISAIAPQDGQQWLNVSTSGIFCIDIIKSQKSRFFIVKSYPWNTTPSGKPQSIEDLDSPSNNSTFVTHVQDHITCPITNPLNRLLPSLQENADLLKDLGTAHGGKSLEMTEILSLLSENEIMKDTVLKLENVLGEAVRTRVQNHTQVCRECYGGNWSGDNCGHASIGILFSGGLDSIVLAFLMDRYVPKQVEIDLINVAFASKLTKETDRYENAVFDTPDRITGRDGKSALGALCSLRKWNFVEVNVTEQELIQARKESISPILHPACTVLDDSIGCALWFAARGQGAVKTSGSYKAYHSPVRVLLIGMGADEQLGGYSRHRAKYSKFGWSGLLDEISMEIDRISNRNLSRDDRIIADHGIESRYPFLDENVVSFLNGLPLWLKMNLDLPRGVGEKLLLRLLAFKLGLRDAAMLPKRAIQFGSRIAKIENSKEKGSDVCERLNQVL